MLWVGLTGSLGTGKSTVTSMLRKMGHQVVDADFISHQVLGRGEKAFQLVLQAFGREILGPDQSIDRKKLAQLVFQDLDKLRLLESIVHPEVKLLVQKAKTDFQRANEKIAFYDVPLLFEKKMQRDFDKIVVVTTTEKLQRERLKARSNWTDAEIDMRLKQMIPIEQKKKCADYLIVNDSSQAVLEEEVKRIVGLILAVAQ